MRPRPPVWALVSSFAAMVSAVGGWTIAQAAQPDGYDPVRDTISALARHGLDHRWIMSLGLAGLGLAHIVSASGLSALRPASRIVLAAAGVATLLVVVFAQPYRGSSGAHIAVATTGFVLLVLWPATTATRRADAPAVLRPSVAVVVSVVSAALLISVGLVPGNGPLGLLERILVFQQALWPFVVIVALRQGRAGRLVR
ncbi:MAG: DUF998 domain-containing protein [Jatrophihabitans sp.]